MRMGWRAESERGLLKLATVGLGWGGRESLPSCKAEKTAP